MVFLSEYDKGLLNDTKIGRKTISDELDNRPVNFTLTEKDIRPMFVQVQVLERGQYFVSWVTNLFLITLPLVKWFIKIFV